MELFIRVKKESVLDICAFFEYFEGLTAIRTPNPETGDLTTLHILAADDFKKEFDILLERMQKRIPWTLTN
ncbi:MAG: hypothetical protein WC901_02295 [Candidatus Margulisiibacteriota bacterium]